MEVDLQLQLEHIKIQKERVATLAANLQQVKKENSRLKPKIAAVQKKKEALERDLLRLQEMERAMGFEIDLNILRALDNPMESDILTMTAYQEKMEKLLTVMNELLMRTNVNYNRAHAEQEDQEADFEQRVADAVQARNILTEELTKTQITVEKQMEERIRQYETIQQLEQNITTTEAEIWLSQADSHRIADQLALLSIKPKSLPCMKAREVEKVHVVEQQKKPTFYQVIGENCNQLEKIEKKQEMAMDKHRTVQMCEKIEPLEENSRAMTFEDLQGQQSQILDIVPQQEDAMLRCLVNNRSTTLPTTPNRLPCDLTEVVRTALQMFDLELE